MHIPFTPDVIHLHLVMRGMVRIEDLIRISQPLVWTLHDEWPLTGGCAYDGGCERYQKGCGRCPLLHSTRSNDLTRKIFKRKQRAWDPLSLTAVAPSRWMHAKIQASPIFHGHPSQVIPNPVDLTVYRPFPKRVACGLLGLNPDVRYILFGALGVGEWEKPTRKGGDLLAQAMQQLAAQADARSNVELLILGASQPEHPYDFGMPAHYCGRLHDDLTLALHYSVAELFAAPSREDNLPNTVVESLACDTPVVAFNIGGMPDMVTHRETGWLAAPFDVDEFVAGVVWVLKNRQVLAGKMRSFAETRFAPGAVAREYCQVYEGMVAGKR